MTQGVLWRDVDLNRVVNVASVPQRSPFRYPGGKTWLVPHVREWMRSLPQRPSEFIEPFAGGGIVGLTVAFERLAEHVTLVELDDQVAAVWRVILGGDGPWLADRIVSFELTPENAARVLSRPPDNLREKAFQTILKNRTYHGGILANGSGMLKYGEAGKGILSRWYPETLQKRILAIHAIRDRIAFVEGDGIEVMRENKCRRDAVFFVDPPYTAGGKKAGKRLYTFCEINHEGMFQVAEGLVGDVLITYDDAPEVRDLADRHGFEYRKVAMTGTHHNRTLELLISRDLRGL